MPPCVCRAWTCGWPRAGSGWCHHSSDNALQAQLHLIEQMLHSDGQWLLQSSSKWSRLGNVAYKLHASVHQQHHMHMLSWNSCGLYLGFLVNPVHQRHLQKAFVSLSCTAISVGVIFVDFFFYANCLSIYFVVVHSNQFDSMLFNVLSCRKKIVHVLN